MKSRKMKSRKIMGLFLLFFCVGISVILGTKTYVTHAADADTNESSMIKLDALIQEYGDTKYLVDPNAGTYTEEQLTKMKTDLESYLKNQDTSTSIKKIEAINKYVATRVYYDQYDQKVPAYPYEVWEKQTAVCMGYSNLLETLMIAEKIPSIQLLTKNHMYNACYDADSQKWIYVDATWSSTNKVGADGSKVENDRLPYNSSYFNISPATLAGSNSHFPYSVSGLEKDGVKYTFYANNNKDNTNVTLNLKTWKNIENWNVRIVGLYDKTKTDLTADELGGYPIVRIYAGCAGTDLETVDLSKTKIERLVWPTSTSKGTFEDCAKLKTVKLPDTVKEIEARAFKNCSALQSVNMPKAISVIQSEAFEGCASLEKLDFTGTSLVSLGGDLFVGCNSLKEVLFGERDKLYIGESVFTNCPELEVIDFSKTNISTLYNYEFYNCPKLKTLDFSASSFTKTAQSTFRKCTSLTEIKLPDTLETIEYMAFSGTAIKTLDLSNTKVSTIQDQGCYDMSKLRNIYFPDTLTTLGDFAFCYSNAGMAVVTNIYSSLTQKQIEKISAASKSVWSGRSLNYPKGTYTLIYDGNGATSGTMKDETHNIDSLQFTLTANAYQKEGYTFDGWNTKADGSGTAYKDKEKVASLTSEDKSTVTLYAVWKEKSTTEPDEGDKEYKINYVLNGGVNNKDNPDTYSVKADVKLKDPTREGYRFTGWYTDQALTKRIFMIRGDSKGDATLYAGWEEEETCTHEWSSWSVTTLATCTKTGTKVRQCYACMKTETATVPVDSKKHVNTEVRGKVAATTTSTGYTGDTYCKDCGALIKKGTTTAQLKSTQNTTKPTTSQTTSQTASKKPDATTEQTAAAPKAVSGIKLVNKKGKTVRITWKKLSGVSGYEIQYALNGKFTKGKKTLNVTSASKTVKKLKKKSTYYVRVRAYTMDGSKKVYGKYSAVKKIKIKR